MLLKHAKMQENQAYKLIMHKYTNNIHAKICVNNKCIIMYKYSKYKKSPNNGTMSKEENS